MRKRIIENWKTTLLGCSVAIISFALVWFGKATFVDVSGFLVTSGLLAWAKDSILKK